MSEKVTLINIDINWQNIAQETIKNCPKIKKEREQVILIDRFGISGKTKTLQSIGDNYNITRERVRQVINNSIKKIQKNCLGRKTQKAIEKIEVAILENGGYFSFEDICKKLTNNQIEQKNSLRFLANLSTKLVYIKKSKELKEGWRTKSLTTKKIKQTKSEVETRLKEVGTPMTIKKLANFLKIDESLAKSALSASPNIMEAENGKWGLISWPQINPKSIRDKSRFIMKKHGQPIHYHDLASQIGQIGTKKVTKQSVHNELIKSEDFILVGRGIYALSEWGYEPGIVEEVIVTILRDAGEPLHKEVIIKRVLERRIVKPSTVILNLQKPKFRKLGKSIYTLN